MLPATHVLAGCLLGINYAMAVEYPEPLAVIIFAAYGSVAPDADTIAQRILRDRPDRDRLKQHLQHRELLHSPLAWLVAWLAFRIVFHQIAYPINGFFLSAFLHIAMDIFDQEGVPLFYPIRDRIRFSLLPRDSVIEFAIVIPVLFWMLILAINDYPSHILYNWDGHLFP